MTPQDTMRLALEALEYHTEQTRPIHKTNAAIEALKAALEQQWTPVGSVEVIEHSDGIRRSYAHTNLPAGTHAIYTAAPAAQPELPQKARPDFIAGYDAGMADALRKINTQEVK